MFKTEVFAQKEVIGAVLIALVIGGGIGFSMGKGSASSALPTGQDATFAGRGVRSGMMGGQQSGTAGARTRSGAMTTGDILSYANGTMTIKTRDGSTKIVLVASSTEIGKTTSGTVADLAVGKSVTLFGDANADGSLTAKSIQLRPAGTPTAPMMGGAPVR